MKTPRAEGPQEPSGEHRRKPDGSRPRKRGGEKGPLGFGSVMRDVKGPGAKGDGSAPGAPGVLGNTTLGMPGFDPALLQAAQLDAGAQAAMKMGAVDTVGEQLAKATHGVQNATEALQTQDRSTTHQANVQPHVPTALGRMTPGALLDTVLDESRRLEIAEAMKELHVELEPEDLGPVVVRLRKGPDGALDISFRAREGDAARVLESGSELLRSRLADAGFLSVAIDVSHDEELRLTR